MSNTEKDKTTLKHSRAEGLSYSGLLSLVGKYVEYNKQNLHCAGFGKRAGFKKEVRTVKLMAVADGYVMVRRKGCMPFVESIKDFTLG